MASRLESNKYDGIYASDMVRTQQTAAPMAKALGEQVTVLPGLNEISAGWFEGRATLDKAAITYMVAPADWLRGDTSFAIPGSVSGTDFNGTVHRGGATHLRQRQQQAGRLLQRRLDHDVDLMNARNAKNSLADRSPAAQYRSSGADRQPGDRVDARGLGRHHRVLRWPPNDSACRCACATSSATCKAGFSTATT